MCCFCFLPPPCLSCRRSSLAPSCCSPALCSHKILELWLAGCLLDVSECIHKMGPSAHHRSPQTLQEILCQVRKCFVLSPTCLLLSLIQSFVAISYYHVTLHSLTHNQHRFLMLQATIKIVPTLWLAHRWNSKICQFPTKLNILGFLLKPIYTTITFAETYMNGIAQF